MRVTSGIFRGRHLRMPRGIRPTQDRVRKSLFDVLGKDVAGRRVLDLFAGSGALGVEALSRGAVSALFVDEDAGAVRAILANLADLGLIETGKRRNGETGKKRVGERGRGRVGEGKSEREGGGAGERESGRKTLPPFSHSRRAAGEGFSHSGEGNGERIEVWRADYLRAIGRIGREGRAFDLVLLDPPYGEGLLPQALRALTGAGGVAPSGLVVAEAEARLSEPEAEGLMLIDERIYGGTKLMFWINQGSGAGDRGPGKAQDDSAFP